MTLTTFVSVKGSPGVTTLACLVGATWPHDRRVAVVEADPFGGDLAARFRLSAAHGWTTYVTASRRSEEPVPIEPHLQALPGGLDVVIGARDSRRVGSERTVEGFLQTCTSSEPAPWDLLVDGGRLLPDGVADCTAPWAEHSDRIVVVLRRDAPSIFSVRERSPALADRYGDRIRLVVVGDGRHHNAAIEEFTGLPVIGEVPFDLAAAHVASGQGGGSRQLSRSLLVVAARRLAGVLAAPNQGEDGAEDEEVDGVRADDGDRSEPATPLARAGRRLRQLRRRSPQDGEGNRPDRPATESLGVIQGTAAALLLPPEQMPQREPVRQREAEPETVHQEAVL